MGFRRLLAVAVALMWCSAFGCPSFAGDERQGFEKPPNGLELALIDPNGNYLVAPKDVDYAEFCLPGLVLVNSIGRADSLRLKKYKTADGKLIPKSDKLSVRGLPHDGQMLCRWVSLAPKAVEAGMIQERSGYTFCSTDGQIMPKDFDLATEFSEGVAAVIVDRELGFIDARGKYLSRNRLPFCEPRGVFCDGLMLVRDAAGKYGYVDKYGHWLIAPRYKSARPFQDGLAQVDALDSYDSDSSNTQALIDTSGRQLPVKFVMVSPCADSTMVAEVARYDNGRYLGRACGLLDISGNWLCEPKYETICPLSDGLRMVRDGKTNKWGYIDNAGREVLAPQFLEASSFGDGLAAVVRDDSPFFVFIDKTGAVKIGHDFGSFSLRESWPRFSCGLCPMPESWLPKALYGYIDTAGDWKIQPRFQYAGNFFTGRAIVGVNRRPPAH